MVSDQELWIAVKNDDEQAFAALFYRYSPRIYSNAYSYIRDRETCHQIVHDIFITLWTNRKTLVVNSFIAYFTTAARYRVYKSLSLRNANRVDYKENLDDFSLVAEENKGYSKMASRDLEEKVKHSLSDLPKRCKEIFLMSRVQQLSNDEIAEKLGISKRTVENQITHALSHLRISLKDLSVILVIYEGISHL